MRALRVCTAALVEVKEEDMAPVVLKASVYLMEGVRGVGVVGHDTV